MNPWMKFIAAVLLFGAWLALVLLHYVPPQSLVDAIGYTLAGLGVYHATAGSVGPIVTGLAGTAELLEPALSQATSAAPVAATSAPVPAPPTQQSAPAPTIQ
ncbi:hypothetical protein [Burkholderia sp. IDO3]|uniref:hypothetical protein n=1 Tax=Burkholderia sp. IDO3 TaxID=1705310 RepID=UPI000BDFE727|nr:hypothetical protein [Burkholderia sp. IDO3]AXK61551.1 hypothetical protein DCN14_01960 [Burkholderia sp. IDO3]PCD58154.1 hypothetical protein CN645_30160 [Burkholderia sp. IDO3]